MFIFLFALLGILGILWMWLRSRTSVPLPTGLYSLSDLGKYRGLRGPCLIGVMGSIYDVSGSENMNSPYQGYGKIWAGRDATVSLALSSLKPEDANRLDWNKLDSKNMETLGEWVKHFRSKYPVVGQLKEYLADPMSPEREQQVMDYADASQKRL